ncbi:2OG-Fe(II) oxygenase [Tamlana crocina]
MIDRMQIVELILKRLENERHSLKIMYNQTKNNIGYFYVDDLLPETIAFECFKVFPKPGEMRCLKSIREYKYVSAQMDKHNDLLEKVIYAFQDKRVVELIGEVCDIESVYPDDSLYAGGLSLMNKDNFLHPHLDNSHDADRNCWRSLNLLYYVTPYWEESYGGNLELWPEGPSKSPTVIESKFNRLVIMATHDLSWHSVNKVVVDKPRCCISNYYFSDNPLRENDKFHVTKFRGRPEDTFTNIILDVDANIRMLIRKIFKKGIRKNPHIYRKETDLDKY